MKREMVLRYIVGPVLGCCMTAVAQDQGYWRAAGSTAKTITGDVAFSDEKIAINLANFTISRIRVLQAEEVSALFDAESNGAGNGSLYRLHVPAAKTFLKKNKLCGSEDTEWMVTYVAGRSLQIAFFSGQKPPVFSKDAIANSTDVCGIFSYGR
ncbi:MAG: hypothetical protein ABSA39_17985 [Edaphobacter sp.]